MLSIALLAGVWVNVSAQEGIRFGIKGGAVLSNFVFPDAEKNGMYSSNNLSFYVGGTVDIPISKKFSLQPGIVFIGKGAKQNESYSITEESMTYAVKRDGKMSPFYIEVPVNLVAYFANKKGRFFVGAGPYYAIGIAGKGKYDISETINSETTTVNVDRNLVFGNKKESDLKRGDFGANFLVGYQWESGFNVHLNYGLGLSDINGDKQLDVKTTNVALGGGLGFTF